LLDISPFRNTDETFGFRVTSLEKLDIPTLQSAVKLSLKRALEYLKQNNSVPFAEAKKCGQYDFHDITRAQELLSLISLPISISENKLSTPHHFAYVCDLRFLKPKLAGRDDMVMFSPDFSYTLSELIERELPKKLPDSLVIVGTFGCMTGMYQKPEIKKIFLRYIWLL
jgi:S-ribosylhomocysteine lyase LuxS involved in autoinducer biosynthesis